MTWFGVERSKVKITGLINVFFTNDYYAYGNAHLTDNKNTAWV